MDPKDLRLRMFVDTNILINATVTPDPDTIAFLTSAAQNEYIHLVTSSFVIWEKFDFVRTQNWIYSEISKGKSYKNALRNSVEIDEALAEKISEDLKSYADDIEEKFGIQNFNLLDSPSAKADLFEFLKKLMYSSSISKQDLLILLSAYETESNAILSKDRDFGKSLGNVKGFEDSLQEALIPPNLKEIKFCRDLKKTPHAYYSEWFTEKLIPKSLARLTGEVFQEVNVVEISCGEDKTVRDGDFLYFLKLGETNVQTWNTKIEAGNMRLYGSDATVTEGQHVTVKLPNEIPVGGLQNTYIFKMD